MKIVGLKALSGTSKKTGKAFNGVVVNYTAPGRDTVGEECFQQFINTDMFGSSQQGRAFDKLIGKSCSINFDRNGYVVDFIIE